MGAYLSAPVTDKHNETGSGNSTKFVVGEMQGWRRYMEDAYVAQPSVEGHEGVSVYGVFDGHGGSEVAKFCSKYIVPEMKKTSQFSEGDYGEALTLAFHRMDSMLRQGEFHGELEGMKATDPDSESGPGGAGPGPSGGAGEGAPGANPMDLGEMLKQVFQLRLRNFDDAADGEGGGGGEPEDALPEDRVQAGCTAVVAVKTRTEVYVANAGDSRAVLCRGGKAHPLSEDHKPAQDIERNRIVAAGGFLSEVGGVTRVNGNLNLSRAIGDLKYKNNSDLPPKDQIITAQPDIRVAKIQPDDAFLLLACDGVWDVMTNQAAIDFVVNHKKKGLNDTEIINAMLDYCLAGDPKEAKGVGCDNMTAMVIWLD